MKTLVDAQGNFMFTFEGEIDLSLPEYDGCQVVDGTEPLQTLIDENDAIGAQFADTEAEHEAELDDLIVRMAALEQRVAELENNQGS